ncbi:stalk domain-containing protein [Paenibacillus sp. NPDC058174]|uniref:stalk domain-containing protein n=1 Tax=Paenibacillus sp. NPDC058174 TaxID=3346366 RepID=UPI0036DBF91C
MRKWGKTAVAAVLAAVVLQGSVPSQAATAAASATILLDDVPLAFDSPPIIEKGVTLVPFRTIGEALGIGVKWETSSNTVTAEGKKDGKAVTVKLQVGSKTAIVNGQKVNLPAAAVMRSNRVLIPLSFFSTQFGATVGWKQATSTVTIVSPQKEMHLRAFYALQSFKEKDLIDSMNSVAFGWSRIDRDGKFTLTGAEYRIPEAAGETTAQSLIDGAGQSGIKPYLMVYSVDGQGELTKMLSSETLRADSIAGITAAVADYQFGGVVLDFEGLGFKLDKQEQQKLLNNYVKQLRAALPADIALSIAVHAPNSAYLGYDYKTLAAIADDLILMAYKFNPAGTASQVPEPNSKVNEAIEMTLKAGVPANKLLLGIDMSAEKPDSIDDKLGLVKRNGLKGAAFWRLGLFRQYTDGMEAAVSASAVKEKS